MHYGVCVIMVCLKTHSVIIVFVAVSVVCSGVPGFYGLAILGQDHTKGLMMSFNKQPIQVTADMYRPAWFCPWVWCETSGM